MPVRGTPSCCALHCIVHSVFCKVQTIPETINTEENDTTVLHYKVTVKANPFKETSLTMWDSCFHSATSPLLIKAATVLLYHSITC